MKKLIQLVCFCAVFLAATAQKKNLATLYLTYPADLIYDTLLVRDNDNTILSPQLEVTKGRMKTEVYLVRVNKSNESSFSVYFGGSSTAVNDSLYFRGLGNNLHIEIKDSFALLNNINFRLQNAYNFEELYSRYVEHFNREMQKYLYGDESNNKSSSQEYSLNAKLDFVRKNLANPYIIDLFAFFVINPKDHPKYDEVNQFYLKNLKRKIENERIRKSIEFKIEHLKHSLDEGNVAPSFSTKSIQNQLINTDGLFGKNVLLTFWATWCAPCIKELPYLKQIEEEYGKDNLLIIGVSLDKDSLKMVNFINERNLNWIQIFNDTSLLETFRINPIPAMFLIDEKGVILYNSANREKETSDLKMLRQMLKQKFNH